MRRFAESDTLKGKIKMTNKTTENFIASILIIASISLVSIQIYFTGL